MLLSSMPDIWNAGSASVMLISHSFEQRVFQPVALTDNVCSLHSRTGVHQKLRAAPKCLNTI